MFLGLNLMLGSIDFNRVLCVKILMKQCIKRFVLKLIKS